MSVNIGKDCCGISENNLANYYILSGEDTLVMDLLEKLLCSFCEHFSCVNFSKECRVLAYGATFSFFCIMEPEID